VDGSGGGLIGGVIRLGRVAMHHDEDPAAGGLLLSIGSGRGYVQAMRTLAEDTAPQTERVLIELLRAASPRRKLAMLLSANRTARLLAMTGLRERHPNDSPAKLQRRLADLWLGPELAGKAYGPFSGHE